MTLSFRCPYRKKSSGIKFGKRGANQIESPLPIHLLDKDVVQKKIDDEKELAELKSSVILDRLSKISNHLEEEITSGNLKSGYLSDIYDVLHYHLQTFPISASYNTWNVSSLHPLIQIAIEELVKSDSK